MLILTRKPTHGDDSTVDLTLEDGRTISVRVLGVKGNQVRLGFEAPNTINIVRRELQGIAVATTPGELNGNKL